MNDKQKYLNAYRAARQGKLTFHNVDMDMDDLVSYRALSSLLRRAQDDYETGMWVAKRIRHAPESKRNLALSQFWARKQGHARNFTSNKVWSKK